MFKNKWKHTTYYELMDVAVKAYNNSIPSGLNFGEIVSGAFKDFVEGITEETLGSTSILKSTVVNQLWCQYIYPTYKRCYCSWVNGTVTELDTKSAMKIFVYNLCAIINRTYDRYSKLIELYEAQKSNLMNGVKTTNTTRFNDTPQNGGDYTSDTYTTDYTKTVSEAEGGTPMERLAEINQLLPNLYEEWLKNFKVLFEVKYD